MSLIKMVHFVILSRKYITIGTSNNQPYKLHIDDFNSGGLITGAIGTGKTTLRLHLIEFFLKHKVRVLDFDYKGETSQYPRLTRKGKVYRPGINYALNLFDSPLNQDKEEYKQSLKRIFIETASLVEPLSPQQIHLLEESVDLTFKQNGDISKFLQNILYLGHQSDSDDYSRNKSAVSLFQKLSWLQNLLGDVFWRDLTHSEQNYKELKKGNTSVFFDFFHLRKQLPPKYFQILLTTLISYHVNNHPKGKPLAIFVEESQLQLHNTNQFSILDEIITVLRFNGIRTFIIATRVDQLSPYIMDNGVICQFRSESKVSNHLFNHLKPYNLSNYEILIKSPSQTTFQKVKLRAFRQRPHTPHLEELTVKYFQKISLSPTRIRYQCFEMAFHNFVLNNQQNYSVAKYENTVRAIIEDIKIGKQSELPIHLVEATSNYLVQTTDREKYLCEISRVSIACLFYLIPVYTEFTSKLSISIAIRNYEKLLAKTLIKANTKYDDFLLLSH